VAISEYCRRARQNPGNQESSCDAGIAKKVTRAEVMRADKQLTEAAEFKDKDSYIAPDGREILYGKDWDARKAELARRSGGGCEQICPTLNIGLKKPTEIELRCPAMAADPHHIIRRSVKRDDRLSNLQALCRYHHNLLDKRKIRSDKAEHLWKSP